MCVCVCVCECECVCTDVAITSVQKHSGMPIWEIIFFLYTVFPKIEAQAYFSGPFSSQPLNEASLYTGSASIHARSSHSGFLQVLFCSVYRSKLESNIVALSLGHNGDRCSSETRLEPNFTVVTQTHTVTTCS